MVQRCQYPRASARQTTPPTSKRYERAAWEPWIPGLARTRNLQSTTNAQRTTSRPHGTSMTIILGRLADGNTGRPDG